VAVALDIALSSAALLARQSSIESQGGISRSCVSTVIT
jgi:hypothetical protein